MNGMDRQWLHAASLGGAVLLSIVLGFKLWYSDRELTRQKAAATAQHHQDMLTHLAAADSLNLARAELDTMYAQQFTTFAQTLASLEGLRSAASEHEDAIYRAPADSLPDIVRRLIADARSRGFLRNR